LAISIDGATIDFLPMKTASTNLCGDAAKPDILIKYSKTFPHSSSTLVLKFSSNLASTPDVESYGFKNISITTFLDPKQKKHDEWLKPTVITDLTSITLSEIDRIG